MSTLEPLQYFVGAVIVGLVLTVWGLWSWCMRLVKERDRNAHLATYERNKAIAFEMRINELTGKAKQNEVIAWRESVLSQYGERQTGQK